MYDQKYVGSFSLYEIEWNMFNILYYLTTLLYKIYISNE